MIDGYYVDGYGNLYQEGCSFLLDKDGYQFSKDDLQLWTEMLQLASQDKDFKIIVNKDHQMNVKLTTEDVNDIKQINKDFFEGECSNSMIVRILLRKGISFYKSLQK